MSTPAENELAMENAELKRQLSELRGQGQVYVLPNKDMIRVGKHADRPDTFTAATDVVPTTKNDALMAAAAQGIAAQRSATS